MKRYLWLLCACFFSLGLHAQQLTLMSYNIRHCQGMDGKIDYDRTSAVIRNVRPDIVALQEVDSATRRSGGCYALGELASRLGMTATFAPAIRFDGGKYGVGILSKENPRAVSMYPLPGKEESRVLLRVDFEDYVVCCTHLSLTDADRWTSLQMIQKVVKDVKDKPVFVLGDLNEDATKAFVERLGEGFRILSPIDVKTFPDDVPTETLDYVLQGRQFPAVRVQDRRVVAESVTSDHRPVFVTCKWKKRHKK